MKEFIAYCGLDCEKCEARIATVNDDGELRRKVAKLWSELNHAGITPEMIHCTGCRLPGAKTPYSDSLCPVRKCARSRGRATCGGCPETTTCDKLRPVTENNPEARRNLESETKRI